MTTFPTAQLSSSMSSGSERGAREISRTPSGKARSVPDLDGETGLADAGRPRQGQEATSLQDRSDLGHLIVPSDEARERGREVAGGRAWDSPLIAAR
jgi:hypothetical protein